MRKVQGMLNLEGYRVVLNRASVSGYPATCQHTVLRITASHRGLTYNNGAMKKVVALLPVKWPLPLSAFESGIKVMA